uniref:DH domain-containing protein n=1 Tax=Anisakis simplex TaxID=6269 RepID=A0A0M3JET8_ANISI
LFSEQLLTSGRAMSDFFDILKPLYDFHRNLLDELEQKLVNWENAAYSSSNEMNESTRSDQVRVGDFLLCAVHNALNHYR